MLRALSSRWRILSLVVCSLVAAWLAFSVFQHEHQPSYQGRTLRQLIELSDKYYGSKDRSERRVAAEGIRHIGTNAIPCLLSWIQYEEPSWLTKLRDTLQQRTGKWIIPVEKVFRANLTIHAFGALDENADAAVPDLVRIMNRPRYGEPSIRAAYALSYIGRPAALAPLLAVMTNHQSPVRAYAVDAIQYMGSNALPAVPLLIECLTDKDEMLAKNAAWSLGELKLKPDLVIPALISSAKTNRPILYGFALHALGEYGTNARPALPLIIEALKSKDERTRAKATNALQKIAPEVLTNASHH